MNIIGKNHQRILSNYVAVLVIIGILISAFALTITNQIKSSKNTFAQNLTSSANTKSYSNLDFSKLSKDSLEYATAKFNESEYDDQKYAIKTTKVFDKNALLINLQKEFPNEEIAIDKIIKNMYEVSITSKNTTSKTQTFSKITDKTSKFIRVVNESQEVITIGFNILKTKPANAFDNFLARPRSQIVSKIDAYASHGLIDAWQTDQGNPSHKHNRLGF